MCEKPESSISQQDLSTYTHVQLFRFTLGRLVGAQAKMLYYQASLQPCIPPLLQAGLPFPADFAALSQVGSGNGSCGCWIKRELIVADCRT